MYIVLVAVQWPWRTASLPSRSFLIQFPFIPRAAKTVIAGLRPQTRFSSSHARSETFVSRAVAVGEVFRPRRYLATLTLTSRTAARVTTSGRRREQRLSFPARVQLVASPEAASTTKRRTAAEDRRRKFPDAHRRRFFKR